MQRSDSIKEIAAALAKAQGLVDRHAEAAVMPQVRKLLRGDFHANQNDGKTPIARFMEKVGFGASDCWYWTGRRDGIGYGRVAHKNENKAHRVAWTLFKGPIPCGMRVLHRCDVRSCVNPEHLFIGTQADNVRDMVQKGRARGGNMGGESNPMHRLTDEAVTAMRALYAAGGITFTQLAERFGVSYGAAYRAVRCQSWRSVQ